MLPETAGNTMLFTSDPKRIIPRFRKLSNNESLKIITAVLQLTDKEVVAVMNQLLRSFSIRYRNITSIFEIHFQELKPLMDAFEIDYNTLSYSRKSLLGAYFTYESAVESAAFFSPCMVSAPDQSELHPGEQRIIISFCSKGDDNQSAIVFRTGILDRFNQLHPEKPGAMPEEGKIVQRAPINKQEFLSRLFSLNGHFSKSEVSALFEGLDDEFTLKLLKQQLTERLEQNPHFKDLVGLANGLIAFAYEIEFSIDSDLSERVILPEPLHHGIENINFIKCTEPDEDEALYFGISSTHAAQQHSHQLITTSDFCQFQVNALSISMHDFSHLTLFPRKINDKYALLASRADGVYLAFSKSINEWADFTKIIKPEHTWELANLAHVGAPLETAKGWLILTQASGVMGQRALGAVLVSLQNPKKVKARASKPVFQVQDMNRSGMPGQGISSSGGILHNQVIVIPYSHSNHTSGYVGFNTEDLISELNETIVVENVNA